MPVILIIMAICVLLSDQPVLIVCSLLAYTSVIRLFWKDGEPKIIFYGLSFFWLSITIKLFYAIFAKVPYVSLSNVPNIIFTTYVALAGFLCFSFGIYVTTKKAREKNVIDFREDFGYSPIRVFYVYLGAFVVSILLKGLIFFVKGLDQLVYAFMDLKLGFIFALLYFTFTKKNTVLFAALILIFEIILSFFSFFASFKEILIVIIITLLTVKIKFTVKSMVPIASLLVFSLFMLLKWQAVKGDYRAFLNQGSSSQTIEVSQQAALQKLQELANEKKDLSKDDKLIYESIDRLSYIEFFAESMIKVPLFIPYEGGKLWAANIAHVLLPRFFFPNKAAIEDSEMVNKYCVRKVSGSKVGVSFSLGFIAESYIDFGPVFMFIMIFLVGVLIGGIYSSVLNNSINYFWGYTMVGSLHTKIACNGTPGSKILGWIITYYIAFWLFKKFAMKPLDNYLRTGHF